MSRLYSAVSQPKLNVRNQLGAVRQLRDLGQQRLQPLATPSGYAPDCTAAETVSVY